MVRLKTVVRLAHQSSTTRQLSTLCEGRVEQCSYNTWVGLRRSRRQWGSGIARTLEFRGPQPTKHQEAMTFAS